MATSTIDILVRARDAASRVINGVSRNADTMGGRLANSMTRAGTAMTATGRTLTRNVSIPLALVGGLAIKAAVDWESAWAGVTKTVDGTKEELAGLEEGIRQMAASDVPATAEEIAAVAEAAGALGIATPNILAFTRTVIDMGESTNLSADMAAEQMARFANIMSTPQTAFDRIGSAIVDLGNNGASTEAEISAMSLNIAAAGRQVNLTEAQVLGFGNALSSLGIEAEKGGTAISRAFIEMAGAVRGGGKELALFSEVAGMSSQQFAQAFEKDAGAAMVAFMTGLGQMGDAGKDVFGILDRLGLGEIRVRDTMLRTAGAAEMVGRSLDISSEAWAKNSALTDEAAKRYATSESQMKIMVNRLREAGIELGQKLVPILLNDVIPAVERLIEWWDNLSDSTQNMILKLGGIAIVAGPLLRLFGGLTTLAGSAVRGVTGLARGLSILGGDTKGISWTAMAAGLGRLVPVLAVLGPAVAAASVGIPFTIRLIEDLSTSEEELAEQTIFSAEQVKLLRDAYTNSAAGLNFTRSQTDFVREANEKLAGVVAELVKKGWTQEEATLSVARAMQKEIDVVGGLSGNLEGLTENVRGYFKVLDSMPAKEWIDQLKDTAATLAQVAAEGAEPADWTWREFTDGAQTALDHGARARDVLAQVHNVLRSGAMDWERYQAMVAQLDLKPPLRDLGEWQETLTKTDWSSEQRTQIAELLRGMDQLGGRMDPAIKGLVQAAISSDRFKQALALLNAEVHRLGGQSLRNLDAGLNKHQRNLAQSQRKAGDYSGMLRTLTRAQEGSNRATRNAGPGLRALMRVEDNLGKSGRIAATAQNRFNSALIRGGKLTRSQQDFVSKLAIKVRDMGGELSNAAAKSAAAAVKTGNFEKAVRILTGEVGRLNKEKGEPTIKVDDTQAKRDIAGIETALNNIQDEQVAITPTYPQGPPSTWGRDGGGGGGGGGDEFGREPAFGRQADGSGGGGGKVAGRQSAAAAPTAPLLGIRIVGTLDTPWGPAKMDARILELIRSESEFAGSVARQRRN